MNLQKYKNKKIYVGISGGVDSGVSALLLKNAGADVTGVFIKTWQPDYIQCTWKEDRLDAMRVCAQLDIPFVTLDLEKEYKENVIDYFLNEYKNNRVPNPDIMCNKYIKFDAFLNFATENNAVIATGHYAKIEEGKMGGVIITPKDKNKDQTYFLYQIKKENLEKIIFPLADLTKDEVRKIAEENDLWVADKKDSQGICMLGGDVSVKDFLIKELKLKKGIIKNEEGEVIGEHDGVELYTIGERHGFNIVKKGIDSKPFFVYQKDQKENVLYVTNDESKIKNRNENIILENVNLFLEINEDKIYQFKTRYRGDIYNSKIKVNKKNNLKNLQNYSGLQNYSELQTRLSQEIELEILNKDIIAVPGQSAVIYDGDILVGGGVIV